MNSNPPRDEEIFWIAAKIPRLSCVRPVLPPSAHGRCVGRRDMVRVLQSCTWNGNPGCSGAICIAGKVLTGTEPPNTLAKWACPSGHRGRAGPLSREVELLAKPNYDRLFERCWLGNDENRGLNRLGVEVALRHHAPAPTGTRSELASTLWL